MFLDPMYFVFAMPPMLLGLWAQFKVKSAFNKYSQVRTQSGVSGAEAARRILQRGGLENVTIETAQLSAFFKLRGDDLDRSSALVCHLG